jgi:hypothetical protein
MGGPLGPISLCSVLVLLVLLVLLVVVVVGRGGLRHPACVVEAHVLLPREVLVPQNRFKGAHEYVARISLLLLLLLLLHAGSGRLG